VRRVGEEVPFVGDPVEDLGRRGEERVHEVANLLGLLFFGFPSLLLLTRYVPRRLDQIRTITAASRVLAGGDARLVAMRAAFSLPCGTLLAYTEDPLGDLRAERYDALLAAAVRRGRAPALVYRLSVSAAPTVRNTSPATRIQVSPIFSRPNSPKRSITAAINRFPAVMIPTVAAVPIRGAANVMPTTITAPIAAADQSQGGSLAASA